MERSENSQRSDFLSGVGGARDIAARWAGGQTSLGPPAPCVAWGSPLSGPSVFLGLLPGPFSKHPLCPLHPQTPCQQELDQVLERISTMRLPDERGPLEHLYSLHIPNCDKNGLYNLKQVGAGRPGLCVPCSCPTHPYPSAV